MAIKITGSKGTATVSDIGVSAEEVVSAINKHNSSSNAHPNISINGMQNVTIEAGNNVSVFTDSDTGKIGISVDVPTNISQLQNDKSHATTSDVTKAVAGIQTPTKTSQLTNDSGFTTMSQVTQAVKDALRESLEASS